MSKLQRRRSYFLTFVILLGLLNPVVRPLVAQSSNIQPILTQIALETPDQTIEVIVQKSATSNQAEELVAQLGGKVTRSLDIIHAFVAEMRADNVSDLAANPAVRWVSLNAPMLKSAGGAVLLRDDFTNDLNGLGNWSGQAWQEIGERDGSTSGDVAITQFLGGELQGVRLQNSGKGIQGFVNLADTANATLNLAYRRKDFDDANDYVALEVSSDGGGQWQEIGRFAGPATDPAISIATYDLAPFASPQFTLRFVTSASLDSTDKFYLDFIQLDYTPKTESAPESADQNKRLFLPLLAGGSQGAIADLNQDGSQVVNGASIDAISMVADYFDTAAFTNNQGSQNWAGNWLETDSGGAGVSVGHVRVASGALRFDNYPVSSGQPSAARAIDLSNTSVAQLSFSFWTEWGVDPSDSAVVEVSKDGGTTYTVLETFTGITGAISGRRTYDLSSFATSGFRLRFRVASNYTDANEYFYADNVQLMYDRIGTGAGWITLIPSGANWKYLDNGSNQGIAWRAATFTDTAWATGQAQLGYGQNDEASVVSYGANASSKYVTTYFRRTFQVADASTFSGLAITLGYDDGAVIYLNGQELTRANMPSGTIAYNTYASTDNAASLGGYFSVPSTYLVSGENVLAVELHQATASSADLSFDLRLDGYSSCVDCINTAVLANQGLHAIRADSVWNGTTRIQGQGVTVAVVDSGIAPHNDTSTVLQSGRVLKHMNFVSNQSVLDDNYGHGSHIAGTIGGSGAKSNGAYSGVAPKANLIDVRVTNDSGSGTTADVVAGLQWILNNKAAYNIRVVNMSLNSAVAQSYHTSPLDAAVEILWFNGIVVVVSSGNNGTTSSGVIYPPANDPFVISVGAVDDKGTALTLDDVIPAFSAYGTTTDNFAKPDLVAPGKNIISLLASDDSNLLVAHPTNAVSGNAGSYYFRMSGTSMASAVVAGAVALLLQDEPNLTPDQVKYRLKSTANKSWPGYDAAKAGAGYLDVYAAINGTSTSNSNTGIAASQLLWTGSSPVVWGSVNWNSVNWNSVNWNSVNWNSVNWNSVNWNSDYWGN